MRQRRPDQLEELHRAQLLATRPSFPSVPQAEQGPNSAPSLLPQGFQEPLTISVTLRTRTRRPLPPRCHHHGLCTPWQLLWQRLPQLAYGGAGELLTQAGAPPTAHALPALLRNRQTPSLRLPASPDSEHGVTCPQSLSDPNLHALNLGSHIHGLQGETFSCPAPERTCPQSPA